MRDAVQYEKNINEFFMTIKAAILADDKTLKKVTDTNLKLGFHRGTNNALVLKCCHFQHWKQ